MRQRLRLPSGDNDTEVDVRWLRSVCSCPDCGSSEAGLRWLSFTDVGEPVVERVASSGEGVIVWWADGHQSTYSRRILEQRQRPEALPKFPESIRRFDHRALVTDDRTLLDASMALCGEGAVLFERAPAEETAIVDAAERFGPIRSTSYGKVQVFRTEATPKTAAHTGRAQHPHTDEPFRYAPPGFLFFHAMEAGPEGEGTTLLVDAVAVAEELRRDDPAAFDTLAEVPVLQHRMHDDEVHFECMAPIITVGPGGDIDGVRLNHRCLAPLDATAGETSRVIDALTVFAERTEDPANQRRIHLEAGHVLAFDNHRIMHGRTAFADTTARHLRSCNVDRDAVHSTLRVLAGRSTQPIEFRLMAGAAT